MTATILETGSIKADLNILKNKADVYGKCIAKGVCSYLGVAFKEPTSVKEQVKQELYRVRASWTDAKSQVGAFSRLENAKQCADVNGLNVYDGKGTNIYSGKREEQIYRVRLSWADDKSQKGAFKDLAKAKALCNKHYGYHVYDKDGKLIHTSTAKPPTNAEKFLESLERLEQEMRKGGFKYSNSGSNLGSTWSDAKAKKYTNCATYTSWALQEAGLLPKGDLFYCKNKKVNTQRGNAGTNLKKVATITYPNKAPKACNLKAGDICGYTTHTQTFAGWDADGNPKWYTMGSADIGKDLPRVRSDYSARKIEVLIRLK